MQCANGHEVPAGSQFCVVCGLAVGAPASSLPAVSSTGVAAGGPSAWPTSPAPYPSTVPRNGFGITALVLGIVGFFTCWLGLVIGPLAVIFGALGIGRANRGEATNRGMALAGVIMGVIVTVLYVLIFVISLLASSQSSRY